MPFLQTSYMDDELEREYPEGFPRGAVRGETGYTEEDTINTKLLQKFMPSSIVVYIKDFLSFGLVLMMCVSMLSAFSISASAATTYKCDRARTITVTTKFGGWTTPSITFKCKADKEFGSRGISNYAPKMSLKINDHKTGATTNKHITGIGAAISSTLKLDKGRTYTITVSYISKKEQITMLFV